jgi:hypothetical protein
MEQGAREMAQVTAELIRERLKSDDRWLARALVALNRRQTADEQRDETTKYHNLQGFTSGHARRGTSMARFYETRGFLTPKQLAWWRQVTPSGRMRIEIYTQQLLKVAREREQERARLV